MASNARERSVRAARKKISDARLNAFLITARHCGVFAVELACEQLDDGESLDNLFYTGEHHGYHLRVKPLGENRFMIEFSCIPGPLCGDGGEWHVMYDGDMVASISSGRDFIM